MAKVYKFLVPFLALLSAGICQAALLDWDRTEATVEMKPGDEEASASFILTNNSPDPIRIERVKTSCGCTGSVVRQKLVRPGESTEIVATFHRGKRRGGVNKNRLEVYLEGREEPLATLRFVALIPVLIETRPQVIYWAKESRRSEREVRVKLDERYLQKIESIDYDHSIFEVTEDLDPENPSGRVLRILPKDFGTAVRGDVRVTASGEDGLKETASVYVFVQP